MSRPSNRVLFLDLGGVVVDVDIDAGRRCWGRPDFDDVWFESGLKRRMERGEISEEDALAEVTRRTGVEAAHSRRSLDAILAPRPAVVAMLQKISKSTICVISNIDPVHATWCRSHAGIERLVMRWIFSFDVGAMKPEPRIFQAALDAMDARPGDGLLLDDRRENIAAAAALGMDGILFESAVQAEAALRTQGMIP